MIESDLENCNLHIDAIYGGSRLGHSGDDPLPELLGVDNGAGFRVLGKRRSLRHLKLVVLVTSFKSREWPDSINRETGLFTYYGDRHEPGPLHETPRDGNLILRNIFEAYHNGERELVPPILIFSKTATFRDVRFLGLAVPGAEGMAGDEDLVAIWRIKDGVRFQNYKASFTILDAPVISREWIQAVRFNSPDSLNLAPKCWLAWRKGGKAQALVADSTRKIRSRDEQLPSKGWKTEILEIVRSYYQESHHDFERCALEIARFAIGNIIGAELTRPWRDGGRDAFGKFRIGHGPGSIDVDFVLEAKLYGASSGVGVKEISRLISRLRHRQFGVLVTTSYLSSQAYSEVVEDGHPVILICAKDISDVLASKFLDASELKRWLEGI